MESPYPADEDVDDMVTVRLLRDVFSTGKTPEATYTPRHGGGEDGRTFDDRLAGKAERRSGGVMLYGVSKSGKTSLAERVLPEDKACWLQGTRIKDIESFWATLAMQLGISEKYSSEVSDEKSTTDGHKFELGYRPIAMGAIDSTDANKQSSSQSWHYTGVPAQQVEDALGRNPTPIIVDDFHHLTPEVRTEIARAIKPLLRKTFVLLIAIPSHSFDPAKSVADIGGRMTKFEIPQWSNEELKAIAQRGFAELGLTDPNARVASEIARRSFGSPHVMQELCYSTLSDGLGIRESAHPSREISLPSNFEGIVKQSATEAEPFAFQSVLSGRNTKGEQRKPIALKSGKTTDIYGIVLMALARDVPPLVQRFQTIRATVNSLTNETVVKQRIVAALSGMAEVADKRKGGADPLFSYREETAYIEDPLFAFHLKYGDWQDAALIA